MSMSKEQIKKRMEKLAIEIEELRYRYHVVNDPRVTDEVYTQLTHELIELEAKYPELAEQHSPTQRVAGTPLDKFEKVKHQTRMLSMQDVFSLNELKAWQKRLQRLAPNQTWNYFAEVKFDGLAISLVYENGILQTGATRGDGFVGENVTQNIRTIQSIPLQLRTPHQGRIEIRGEVVMPKKVLQRLNSEQEKQGLPKFANTRNAAAGSIRQLDPRLAARRNLDFFAWDVLAPQLNLKTHAAEHAWLKAAGFKTGSWETEIKNLNEAEKFIQSIETKRESFPFGIDGVVFSVNELSLHEVFGVVGKAPRYMAAYKFPAEQVVTQLVSVSAQVGRTGALTPVAHFKPVLVAGSTVSKATLHNYDQINRLDVRIGDTVVIQKAGDIIPEVVAVLPKFREKGMKKIVPPQYCPVCGSTIGTQNISAKRKGEALQSVSYYCLNTECPARNQRALEHFVQAMEIYELGPKILEQLQREGLISSAADLYDLEISDLKDLERLGEKSATNIIASINITRKVDFERFLYSLGIPGVGTKIAHDLAARFGSLQKLSAAHENEIEAVFGIGKSVAAAVVTWFSNQNNQKLLEQFAAHGLKIKNTKKIIVGVLSGKTLVLTGTLPTLSRTQAQKLILSAGGQTSESVSKQTSFVVAGEKAGSKLKKAAAYGIPILSEKEFLTLIKSK